MPEAMPPSAATASASSTTSSRLTSRSPSATTFTLHLTGAHSSHQYGQDRGQLFQTAQRMPGPEQIDVGCRDHHAERARLEVPAVAHVGIHPHHPVTQPGQPLHRGGQHLWIAPVQPVGADHHDAAPAHTAPSPVPDERVDTVADPGAALPVEDGPGGLLHRVVETAPLQ